VLNQAQAKGRLQVVDPEPYFSPLEYLYLSKAVIQRHHMAAPLTRKKNPHFEVGSLEDVKMEEIVEPSMLPSMRPTGG
jgi:hypothetical protein